MYNVKILSSWSQEDTEKLYMLYENQVPNKLIALYFKRSATSISKTLDRSGIKAIFKRKPGTKRLQNRSPLISLNEMERYVRNYDRSNLCLQWHLGGRTAKTIKISQANKPSLDQATEIPRVCASKEWKSLEYIIEFLKNQGHKVTPYPTPLIPQQEWAYLMDGKPTTALGLLMFVNQKRLEVGQERILIPNLSH